MKYGERVLLKEYKNGNKLWGTVCKCAKCQGTGKVIWSYADHVCFDCDGKGWYYFEEREYTPENLSKLEAKRAKKAAAEQAERKAAQAEQEAREAAWKAEQAERERIRRGHYYGEVGQKVEIEVVYKGNAEFETAFGWMSIYRFDTDDGAHLIWKTGSILGGEDIAICEGDRITIKATIKGHQEYRGVEQTELQRVKVVSGGINLKDFVSEYGENAVVIG